MRLFCSACSSIHRIILAEAAKENPAGKTFVDVITIIIKG